MARRKFTREFKISAVQLVNYQGYTVGAAAAPAGEGAVEAKLRRLREENARLPTERDILKKAPAFFAKEQA